MHYWSNHICFNMKWIHVVYMNFNVQVLSKFLMLLLWVCSVLRVVPLLKVYTSHTNETVNRPTKNYTNQNVKDKVGLDSVWSWCMGVIKVWLEYLDYWLIWEVSWYKCQNCTIYTCFSYAVVWTDARTSDYTGQVSEYVYWCLQERIWIESRYIPSFEDFNLSHRTWIWSVLVWNQKRYVSVVLCFHTAAYYSLPYAAIMQD